MSKNFRSFAWLAALMLWLGLNPAWAQTAPSIRSFTVDQVTELVPGTELVFRLQGSAAATVSLTLDGSANVVSLRETRAGSYEGAYTLNTRDQVRFNSAVRATMRLGERETQALLGQTLLTASAHKAALVAATPTPVVEFFGTSAQAYTGGQEIAFTLRGTPGGQVTLALAGSDVRLALAEVKPGEYGGLYTVRTRDRLGEQSVATATLTLGTKSVKVEKALGAAALQPTLAARQACDTCGVVQAVDVVEVKGEASALGTVAGGVAGAVLGNQVGKGDGRKVATVLGAVGGALAGREIEKHVGRDKRYDVTVRLHHGAVQTVSHAQDPGVKVGAQVKIVDGAVVAND